VTPLRRRFVAAALFALAAGGTALAYAAGSGSRPEAGATGSLLERREPATATAPAGGRPVLREKDLRCGPGQARAVGLAEPDPAYVNGPDSARTPRAAVAQRVRWLGDALRGEDLTWQQVGPTRADARPMAWARWAGLGTDGRVRAVFTVQGGRSGGGWLVTGTLLCSDVPSGFRPY
jgi:hypothetical protein